MLQRDRAHCLRRITTGNRVAFNGRHRPQRVEVNSITERIVLIAEMPTAPPRTAASEGSLMLVMLGVIFAHTGMFETSVTQDVTSSQRSGCSPISDPILRSVIP